MMKIVAVLLVALSFHSAAADGGSMKGWEIYSWFDMKCSANPHLHSAPNADSVCFALVHGTNRQKTADEIRKTPLAIAVLEQQIAKLAKGVDVFWNAPDKSFDLPDAARGNTDPRNRAVAAMKRHGVKLTVVTPTP
jgi:hypothetical protein